MSITYLSSSFLALFVCYIPYSRIISLPNDSDPEPEIISNMHLIILMCNQYTYTAIICCKELDISFSIRNIYTHNIHIGKMRIDRSRCWRNGVVYLWQTFIILPITPTKIQRETVGFWSLKLNGGFNNSGFHCSIWSATNAEKICHDQLELLIWISSLQRTDETTSSLRYFDGQKRLKIASLK